MRIGGVRSAINTPDKQIVALIGQRSDLSDSCCFIPVCGVRYCVSILLNYLFIYLNTVSGCTCVYPCTRIWEILCQWKNRYQNIQNFPRLPYDEKMKIKQQGRPLSEKINRFSRGKQNCRIFNTLKKQLDTGLWRKQFVVLILM